jgi:hypothetical protein
MLNWTSDQLVSDIESAQSKIDEGAAGVDAMKDEVAKLTSVMKKSEVNTSPPWNHEQD